MLMGNTTDTLSTEQKSYIQQFKDKAKQFWSLWNDLDRKRDLVMTLPPDIQNDYTNTMEKGSSIKTSIEYVTGLIDYAAQKYQDVKDWISSTFGLSGLEGYQKAEQLGVIPLIAVGVIAAALAAITAWIAPAYTLNVKLNKYDQLISQGKTPDQAAAIVKGISETGGGIMQGIGQAVPFALLGLGALFFLMRGAR